jgi:phage RecT family recombinase
MVSETPGTIAIASEQATGAVRMIEAQNFAPVLPSTLPAEKFQRWAVHLLTKPELQEVARTDAGRLSIVKALMDCASLGLEPGREYHLVPFAPKDENNVKLPPLAVGIIDYKGEVRLITNARRCSVIARLVREKDQFYMRGANAVPMHEPPDSEDPESWFDDTRPVIGGYTYADYGNDEISLVIRMSEAEFLKHRAKARAKGVWDEWPDAMRLKTLVHQLRKWVPWSAEWVA